MIGLEYQAHAEKMREHSLSELGGRNAATVEKITALGGEPTTEVAPPSLRPTRARRSTS